jgi:hypothetical protein
MRLIILGFAGVLLLSTVLQGTGCSRDGHSTQGDSQMSPDTSDDQQRWPRIVGRYDEIEPGMSSADVEQRLGRPDQIHPLYEPKTHNPNQIGTSWFYMRMPLPGDQRGDTEIVVRFDLKAQVVRVDTWGLDK